MVLPIKSLIVSSGQGADALLASVVHANRNRRRNCIASEREPDSPSYYRRKKRLGDTLFKEVPPRSRMPIR